MILLLTRGLPGSGKTSAARAWQAIDPETRIYTDRDELRSMLFGVVVHPLPAWKEDMVTVTQHDIVEDSFSRGLSVAVADTNLRDDRLDPLLEIARDWHARVETMDFRAVPIEVCARRDYNRMVNGGRYVGEAVIRDMARRYGLPTEGS